MKDLKKVNNSSTSNKNLISRKTTQMKYFKIFFSFLLFFNICISSDCSEQKTIMIIVHTETVGGKGVLEIYHALKKKRCRVKIIALPQVGDGEIISDVDLNFTKKFDKEDVIYPCGNKKPYKKCVDLKNYKPDFIITQNPYDMTSTYKGSVLEEIELKNLKKITKKIAYIVYGPHIFHQDFCNDEKLKDNVDIVFVDSKSTKKNFIKKLKFFPENVYVSGYQNYKNVREKLKRFQKTDSGYRETILWLPRWALSFKDRDHYEGGSTFLSYHYFFFNYAKNNPDIKLILRPHGLLFPRGVSNKFFSQKQVDEIIAKFKSLKNVIISDHVRCPLDDDVIQADIVISDGTSALGEVIVAEKPIIYLSNGWNSEFDSNDLGKEFKNYLYFAHNPDEILEKIDFIREKGYLPFAKKIKYTLGATIARSVGLKMWEIPKEWYDFKKLVDPVENPAEFIASTLLAIE